MITPTWRVTLKEDPDTQELILPLPSELIEQLGWQEGDVLVWDIAADGCITLSKSPHD